MAFLFSSPVLNPVIIALLLSLFGDKVTVVYAAVTFFSSIVAAALLSKLGMESQVKPLMSFQAACCTEQIDSDVSPMSPVVPAAACCCSAESIELPKSPDITILQPPACCSYDLNEDYTTAGTDRVPFKEKIKKASVSAVDIFKGVSWYIPLGGGIGSFIYGFFPQELVVKLAGPDNPWSIPVAAAVGVPMYIRAETVIPISAALVGKGMGLGTVLALIIGGAGASIPEMIILGSMFRKKLVFAFALNVFLVAIAGGYLVDLMAY